MKQGGVVFVSVLLCAFFAVVWCSPTNDTANAFPLEDLVIRQIPNAAPAEKKESCFSVYALMQFLDEKNASPALPMQKVVTFTYPVDEEMLGVPFTLKGTIVLQCQSLMSLTYVRACG
jgi:hypothetical protein